MKTKNKPYLPLLLAVALMAPVARSLAQTFDSGSTGGLGELNVITDTTLDLPPDGSFHYTTITVANGATLRFNRNALNTPVYLLATGDITINGSINVSGKNGTTVLGGQSGPGGFDGGIPGVGGGDAGDGHGPGAGKRGDPCYNEQGCSAGGGAYFTSPSYFPNAQDGVTYGSPLLVPLVGGSGGGGERNRLGGGGGGGAILLASNTRIALNGNITAYGGEGGAGAAGSAGAARLVAPQVLGTGVFNLAGQGDGARSGAGRASIDTLDRSQLQIDMSWGGSRIGSFMTVFPPNLPRLDILEAAGTSIPEGTSAPVFVTLPFGSDTNRTVTVQARNFNVVVPIEVVLTPDTGPAIKILTSIDNAASNPASVVVPVGLPISTVVAVNVWKR